MVQEYERAVVFRLGRLRSGGAKGPGLFFVMPCVDSYKKVDLRTVSFDVPPQEVSSLLEQVRSKSKYSSKWLKTRGLGKTTKTSVFSVFFSTLDTKV